jgi:DNA-binding XRE family transcriptional regulator
VPTLADLIDLYHARQAARPLAGEAGSGTSAVNHREAKNLVFSSELTSPSTPFGRVLRELRRQRRMTQADLGDMVGLDHSYISHLERSTRPPSWLLAQEIASALGLDRAARTVLLDATGLTARARRAS